MKKSPRKKSPWFAFYADDYVGGTRRMSLSERGAFTDLLAHQWLEGPIPKEDDEICRLIGAFPDEWQAVKAKVLSKFDLTDEGYVNERLEKERAEREGIRQKRVEAASKRWSKPDASASANGDSNGNANAYAGEFVLQDASTASSSTTSTSSTKAAPSTPSSAPTPAIAWSAEGGWEGISEKDREDWSEAYPACDISRQLAEMNQWLLSNPAKAKKKQWRRFITNWLGRSQERGGDTKSSPTVRQQKPTITDYEKSEQWDESQMQV